MEGMNGTLNAEQATTQVYGTDQTWHTINSCLERGATVTAESAELHEKFWGEVWRIRKLRDVVMPNNVRVIVVKQGKCMSVLETNESGFAWHAWLDLAPHCWNKLFQNRATLEQAPYANYTTPVLPANAASAFQAPSPATMGNNSHNPLSRKLQKHKPPLQHKTSNK